MDSTGLPGVLSKLLLDVLTALVGAPTIDAAAEGNKRRADEQFKRLKRLVLAGQQVDGGPHGVLIGSFADVLVDAYGHWRKGPHQVLVAQFERLVGLVVGCLRVSKLLSFPHGANVAV